MRAFLAGAIAFFPVITCAEALPQKFVGPVCTHDAVRSILDVYRDEGAIAAADLANRMTQVTHQCVMVIEPIPVFWVSFGNEIEGDDGGKQAIGFKLNAKSKHVLWTVSRYMDSY